MDLAIKKSGEKYRYKDYITWPDNERWELIDGVAYNMSPAPSTEHQRILRKLLLQIGNFLIDKTCEVFGAPFDVRLPDGDEKDEDIDKVVQPDLAVICDPSKLDDKGCRGTPDLIIEIISPHTAAKDMKEKFFLYERHGVREYWIVHPYDRIAMVFRLGKDNKYERHDVYTCEDRVTVGILKDLIIDLSLVFGKEAFNKGG